MFEKITLLIGKVKGFLAILGYFQPQ